MQGESISVLRHRMKAEAIQLREKKRSKQDTMRSWLCALYLAAALLMLGCTVARCYPNALHAVRVSAGGRAAQAFSALTDALERGGSVREAFADITGNETQD